jgi:hypothetical protein
VLSPQNEFFRYFNELTLPSTAGQARSGPDLAAERPPQPPVPPAPQ